MMECGGCNGLHGEGGVKIENCYLIRKSNNDSILVDSCMSDLIKALNKAGVKTLGSCCGHGERPGTILISLDNLSIHNLGEELRVAITLPRAKDLKEKI